MKKILSIAVALTLCFALTISASAGVEGSATEASRSQSFDYQYAGSSYEVSYDCYVSYYYADADLYVSTSNSSGVTTFAGSAYGVAYNENNLHLCSVNNSGYTTVGALHVLATGNPQQYYPNEVAHTIYEYYDYLDVVGGLSLRILLKHTALGIFPGADKQSRQVTA